MVLLLDLRGPPCPFLLLVLVLSIGIVTWMMAAFNYVIAIFCMPGTATLGSGTQDKEPYRPLFALLTPAMPPSVL